MITESRDYINQCILEELPRSWERHKQSLPLDHQIPYRLLWVNYMEEWDAVDPAICRRVMEGRVDYDITAFSNPYQPDCLHDNLCDGMKGKEPVGHSQPDEGIWKPKKDWTSKKRDWLYL